MSNRTPEPIEIEGGCNVCPAVQTVMPDPEHSGVWHVRVRHEPGCTTLRATANTGPMISNRPGTFHVGG